LGAGAKVGSESENGSGSDIFRSSWFGSESQRSSVSVGLEPSISDQKLFAFA